MKKEEILLYVIGDVDTELVPSGKKKRAALKLAVTGALAAAAAIAGFVVIRGAVFSGLPSGISPFDGEGIDIMETENISAADNILTEEDISEPSETAADDLPKIPYKSFRFNSGFLEESLGNMGYNSADKMITDCPWNEEQNITSMPVFKNLSYGGDYVYPDGYLNEEKMKAMAEETAEALGLTIREYDFSNEFYSGNEGNLEDIEYRQDGNCLSAVCDGESYGVEAVKIYVFGRGEISVLFDGLTQNDDPNYMKLPEEYANDGDALSDYLMERFEALIDMENPSGSALSLIYNVTDNPVQNIVNYSLEPFEFNTYYNNQLVGMMIGKKLCVAEKVGEYEIITYEEAQSKLLSAYESFELPDDWPEEWYDLYRSELTEADIEGVTLLYYTELDNDEYFKPYYCFYVKSWHWSPDWDVYETYYVPALTDEHVCD